MDRWKPLPTLIREMREAAYAAGRADGLSLGTVDRVEAHRVYGEAARAVIQRLDELGLR